MLPVTPDPSYVDSGGAWLEASDGQRWLLHGKCSLGRGPENDVVIDYPKASRKHAVIRAQDDGQYWLIDLMSRNGTYRNDRRLIRPTRLRHRDQLHIGGQNFVFQQPVPPPNNGDDPATTTTINRSTAGDATVGARFAAAKPLVADRRHRRFYGVERENGGGKVGELSPAAGCAIASASSKKALGRIPKYTGEPVLACWEEHGKAAPAVVTAIHDFQRLRKDCPVRFRVALHFGLVTFGEQSEWGEQSILGPEMNYIFRLEDLASKLGVGFCLSSSAQAKLASLVSTESVPGEHQLKGFDGLHRCFCIPDEA